MKSLAWLFGLFGLSALYAGCSATSDDLVFGTGDDTGTSSSGSGGGQQGGQGGASNSTSSGDISVGVGSGGGGGAGGGDNQIAEVYGHSPSELYRLDPNTKEVQVVGSFKGCSSVIDIALDKDSNLYGTTFGAFYKIDKQSAVCTLVSNGSYPNSLSFVPKGTLDPNAEALVGYNGADYIRINTQSGAVTTIKTGALSSGYISSGDIVSVINGPTYLTIKGNECSDCIVELDPKTGSIQKNWGPIPYSSVFGLAFWAGSAYGFTDGGELFEVSFANNKVTTVLIPIPGAPLNLQFWGAGSTTSAPTVPIPQ